MNVKISVIIPVYNAERYLEECLQSVLQQSLKEIEIICVDDGSTDQSKDILDNLAKQDHRVLVLQQNNQGAGIARNKALDVARGEFIVFMDSDDSYPSNATLEHLYIAAVEHDALIVGGYCNICREDYEGPNKEDPLVKICESNPDGTFVEYKDFQFDFNYQAYLFSHKLLVDNHIVFPKYRRFQDPPFFVKAMICAERFFVIPECTYCYKYGHQNIKWNSEKINDMVCGHIDNLLISRENKLGNLHKTTASRLEFRYKELLVNQLNLQNLRLYALCAYANSIVDFDLIEVTTRKKRRINRLYILEALEEKIAKILVQEVMEDSFEDKLERIIRLMIREYKEIDKDNELVIIENIVCLLGNLLKENRPYFVRYGVLQFQKKEIYDWMKREIPKLEEPNQAIVYSLQKLECLSDAFAFSEKMQKRDEKIECQCVYKATGMDSPKVSVIIPVYDVESYLRDCLDSVVNQTLKEIEIICVDDESPDGCYNILMEYATKYHNITVLKQKNSGLSAARNSGMLYARGKYIHFLDSDDSMKTDAYEKLVAYAEKQQLDLLFFDGESFYETSDLQKEYPWYRTGYTTNELAVSVCNTGEEYFENAVLSDNFKMHAGMYITKRELVKDNHLTFINGILHEDNYYTIKVTLLAGRTGIYQEPLYNRRVRRGSLTIIPLDFRHAYGYFISYCKLYEFYCEKNFSDTTNDVVWLKLRQIMHNGLTSYRRIEDPYQKLYYLALPTKEMTMFYELFVESERQLADVKETLIETKRILQRTYDEKFDRGVEIKRLNKQIQGIKKSRTYRLARFFGFPIRVLKRIKKKMKKTVNADE